MNQTTLEMANRCSPERDRTSMAYWFPKVVESGVPYPKTEHVALGDDELISFMRVVFNEGEPLADEHKDRVLSIGSRLADAASKIGDGPWFLRNSHFSGKHDFDSCCFVTDADSLRKNAVAIAYMGELVGVRGFPVRDWYVREYLNVTPLFTAFGSTPIIREFRLFAAGGRVHQYQPYWPADSISGSRPDNEDWERILAEASVLDSATADLLGAYAETVSGMMPADPWSIDFLEDADGKWWLTDMALEHQSYKSDDVLDWPRRRPEQSNSATGMVSGEIPEREVNGSP